MPCLRLASIATVLASTSLAARAQGIVPLIEHGHPLGSSTYGNAQYSQVDDAGNWTVIARTPLGWTLVRNGTVLSRAGTPMPAGLAGSIVEFVHVAETGDGFAVEILSDQVVQGSGQVSIVWNGHAIASEGDPVLLADVPPGTTFRSVALVDANERGQVLLLATLDPGGVALLRYDLAGDGSVLGGAVLVRVGDVPAGSPAPVTKIDSWQPATLNAHGSWLVGVELGGEEALLHDGRVLAITGGPSPVPGRSYRRLSGPQLNDRGETLFWAEIEGVPDGSDTLLVREGTTFFREGNLVPGLGFATAVGGGFLTSNGDVFWDALIGGRFYTLRNVDSVLLGDQVGGRVIEAYSGFFSDFSDDGGFWVGDVVFDDGTRALVRASFGGVAPIDGCAGNPGQLVLVSGLALPGDQLDLKTLPATLGASALVKLSLARAAGGPDCGVLTPYGELLIDPRQTFATFHLAVAGSILHLPIPPEPSLVGVSVFAQGAVVVLSTPIQLTMTNALELTFGAP